MENLYTPQYSMDSEWQKVSTIYKLSITTATLKSIIYIEQHNSIKTWKAWSGIRSWVQNAGGCEHRCGTLTTNKALKKEDSCFLSQLESAVCLTLPAWRERWHPQKWKVLSKKHLFLEIDTRYSSLARSTQNSYLSQPSSFSSTYFLSSVDLFTNPNNQKWSGKVRRMRRSTGVSFLGDASHCILYVKDNLKHHIQTLMIQNSIQVYPKNTWVFLEGVLPNSQSSLARHAWNNNDAL